MRSPSCKRSSATIDNFKTYARLKRKILRRSNLSRGKGRGKGTGLPFESVRRKNSRQEREATEDLAEERKGERRPLLCFAEASPATRHEPP